MRSRYLIILFLLLPSFASGSELEPFTTDGCSSFPDGTPAQQSLWAECCIRHDLAYWKGGSYEERLDADRALEACVARVGEPAIAAVMLAGVRVGGSPYFPTFYRWGYGWPFPRGYKVLSTEEQQQVKQHLAQFKLMIDSIADEIN
ncbi:MAG: FAD-binding oxidoreductase [Gammaproteobacteria bacterium]|nr:FAD-binding oxidoreductase [Gammaproteobacteria bacterium]